MDQVKKIKIQKASGCRSIVSAQQSTAFGNRVAPDKTGSASLIRAKRRTSCPIMTFEQWHILRGRKLGWAGPLSAVNGMTVVDWME
jgi:hypothetical protein